MDIENPEKNLYLKMGSGIQKTVHQYPIRKQEMTNVTKLKPIAFGLTSKHVYNQFSKTIQPRRNFLGYRRRKRVRFIRSAEKRIRSCTD